MSADEIVDDAGDEFVEQEVRDAPPAFFTAKDGGTTLYVGGCLDVLRTLPDASVDAVVTDPPYGLEFMGKEWDGPKLWREYDNDGDRGYVSNGRTAPKFQTARPSFSAGLPFQRWCEAWATECLRVLKPGGHMLAFGGTRTWHRLACAVEDAGFEVRDSIAWLYGSGFPKSLDVSKAIDKAAGAEREVLHSYPRKGRSAGILGKEVDIIRDITAPATPDAEQWQGWGTALKPGFEPIVVARKPLAGTVAANVLEHGTGALNIDACRVGFVSEADRQSAQSLAELRAKGRRMGVLGEPGQGDSLSVSKSGDTRTGHEPVNTNPAGRWPANVVLDDTQAAVLDEMSGKSKSPKPYTRNAMGGEDFGYTVGGASRFFTQVAHEVDELDARFMYSAKAPKKERPVVEDEDGKRTAHPTVKPLGLMRWLIRLVTPPGGVVLDAFVGSGTTIEAARLEGFQVIGIEREAEYVPLIVQRVQRTPDKFSQDQSTDSAEPETTEPDSAEPETTEPETTEPETTEPAEDE